MKLKAIKYGKSIALVFNEYLVEKLNITDRTEFDYRKEGTRLILYPQENEEITEYWVLQQGRVG